MEIPILATNKDIEKLLVELEKLEEMTDLVKGLQAQFKIIQDIVSDSEKITNGTAATVAKIEDRLRRITKLLEDKLKGRW